MKNLENIAFVTAVILLFVSSAMLLVCEYGFISGKTNKFSEKEIIISISTAGLAGTISVFGLIGELL